MKLTDLDKLNNATQSLKEHFSFDFDASKLNKIQTSQMLGKVKKLISEAKSSHDFHKSQNNPSYLKLLFVKDALSEHLNKFPKTSIIVENNEVEKSQVILAAQDMVDTLQKMYEDINDMMVKELPALVDSIQSEIGVNESTTFQTEASESLSNLNTALKDSMNEMKAALSSLTGQSLPDAFGSDEGDNLDLETDDDSLDLDIEDDTMDLPSIDEIDLDLDLSNDEDEAAVTTGVVGRAKR